MTRHRILALACATALSAACRPPTPARPHAREGSCWLSVVLEKPTVPANSDWMPLEVGIINDSPRPIHVYVPFGPVTARSVVCDVGQAPPEQRIRGFIEPDVGVPPPPQWGTIPPHDSSHFSTFVHYERDGHPLNRPAHCKAIFSFTVQKENGDSLVLTSSPVPFEVTR